MAWRPGSVRFERLRDGIEDFEKIRLLRERAAKDLGDEDLRAARDLVETALINFTWERGKNPGVHSRDVRKAVEAINQAAKPVGP